MHSRPERRLITATSRSRPWPILTLPASTSSPALKCSNTCLTRPSIVASLSRLARPGGHVICSTINRNAKAFALAIVGAEYVLRLLPMGTHQYARLIRPSELSLWARTAGLELADLAGLEYDPAGRKARIGADVSVNYLAHYRRRMTPVPA